jgi:hypothetical protein
MADEHTSEKPAEAGSSPEAPHVHGEHCAHTHGEHCAHGAPAVAPFSNAEIAAMHDEDRKAASNIVLLMVAVFVSGVIGYMVVDYFVSQGW